MKTKPTTPGFLTKADQKSAELRAKLNKKISMKKIDLDKTYNETWPRYYVELDPKKWTMIHKTQIDWTFLVKAIKK